MAPDSRSPASRISEYARRLAVLALFVGLALVPSISRAQTPAPAPTPIVAGPVTSPGNAKWTSSLNEAKSRAGTEQKLVFVEMEAPECGNCRRMDALLYPAMDFEALLLKMVPVKLDIRNGEGREVADRYGLRDTPAVLVLTPEGRLVFRMEGFVNLPEFYEHIHKDLEKYREFAKRIDSQNITALRPREALETGVELYQRSDPESALPRLRRAASNPKSPAAVRDAARESLAAVELELGQIPSSRRTIERLIATTKDSQRRERAEIFRAQLPLAENKPAEAAALFRKFRQDHPKSAYLARVDAILKQLTEGPSQ